MSSQMTKRLTVMAAACFAAASLSAETETVGGVYLVRDGNAEL